MQQQPPGQAQDQALREALRQFIDESLLEQGPIHRQHRQWVLGRFDHGRWLLEALRELGVPPEGGGRFLDIGSGFGGEVLAFASAGVRTIAVELYRNTRLLGIARSFALPLQVIQADGLRLPFRDGCFEVTSAFEVLEHVEAPEVLVREMARVTKPGGLALWTTPVRPWLTRFLPDPHYKIWGLALRSLERQKEIVERKGLGPYERAELLSSARQLRGLCERAGLAFGVYAEPTRRAWLAPVLRLFFGTETGACLVPGRESFFWGRKASNHPGK